MHIYFIYNIFKNNMHIYFIYHIFKDIKMRILKYNIYVIKVE